MVSFADTGKEYVAFHAGLEARPRVKGVTFFLSHGVGFEKEAWLTRELASKGIGAIVGGRNG
jgi:hypothetical protein